MDAKDSLSASLDQLTARIHELLADRRAQIANLETMLASVDEMRSTAAHLEGSLSKLDARLGVIATARDVETLVAQVPMPARSERYRRLSVLDGIIAFLQQSPDPDVDHEVIARALYDVQTDDQLKAIMKSSVGSNLARGVRLGRIYRTGVGRYSLRPMVAASTNGNGHHPKRLATRMKQLTAGEHPS